MNGKLPTSASILLQEVIERITLYFLHPERGPEPSVVLENGYLKKKKIIYVFLAALGLHCCVRAFSSCGEQGLLFIAVCGLLIAAASLVAEHGL